MAYDAAAILASMERPTITLPRMLWWERVLVRLRLLGPTITIRGRVLSHMEWIKQEVRVDALSVATTPEEVMENYLALFDVMGVPRKRMRRMPLKILVEASASFFTFQVQAQAAPNAKDLERVLQMSGILSTPKGDSRSVTPANPMENGHPPDTLSPDSSIGTPAYTGLTSGPLATG